MLIVWLFIFQTTLPDFAKSDFFVVRQHEEFVWLHDRFEENEEYAGYIVREVIFICEICKTFFSNSSL